jgi:hypothetical protein
VSRLPVLCWGSAGTRLKSKAELGVHPLPSLSRALIIITTSAAPARYRGKNVVKHRESSASGSVDRSARASIQQMRRLHNVSKPCTKLPFAQLKSAILSDDWFVSLEDSVTSHGG